MEEHREMCVCSCEKGSAYYGCLGSEVSLEKGKQCKFLGVVESLVQEEQIALECAAKEHLCRWSVVWSSPLSDYNRVMASNQFTLPVFGNLT